MEKPKKGRLERLFREKEGIHKVLTKIDSLQYNKLNMKPLLSTLKGCLSLSNFSLGARQDWEITTDQETVPEESTWFVMTKIPNIKYKDVGQI